MTGSLYFMAYDKKSPGPKKPGSQDVIHCAYTLNNQGPFFHFSNEANIII